MGEEVSNKQTAYSDAGSKTCTGTGTVLSAGYPYEKKTIKCTSKFQITLEDTMNKSNSMLETAAQKNTVAHAIRLRQA